MPEIYTKKFSYKCDSPRARHTFKRGMPEVIVDCKKVAVGEAHEVKYNVFNFFKSMKYGMTTNLAVHQWMVTRIAEKL